MFQMETKLHFCCHLNSFSFNCIQSHGAKEHPKSSNISWCKGQALNLGSFTTVNFSLHIDELKRTHALSRLEGRLTEILMKVMLQHLLDCVLSCRFFTV